MDGILRRRAMTQHRNPWTMLKHNSFDTYTVYNAGGNNSTFAVMDNGEWAQVTSNGGNSNNSNIYVSERLVYADIKDTLCRITWNVECNKPDEFDSASGVASSGNLGLGFFTVQNQYSGNVGTYRRSSRNIATYATILGYHQVEFVPSDFLAGLSEAAYFGWHFAIRTSDPEMLFRIIQCDFEVKV